MEPNIETIQFNQWICKKMLYPNGSGKWKGRLGKDEKTTFGPYTTEELYNIWYMQYKKATQ